MEFDGEDVSFLSLDQIETFLRDGVLVVDQLLGYDEIQVASAGLKDTLTSLPMPVDTNALFETGQYLQELSSTNGSGGVLDIFYQPWQLRIATHAKLFRMTTELWKATYGSESAVSSRVSEAHDRTQGKASNRESLPFKPHGSALWKHPFGPFDTDRGYCYLDRIGYRLPTQLAEQLGAQLASCTTKDPTNGSRESTMKNPGSVAKKKKNMAIQRSLTPHLDCCPDNLYSGPQVHKFRPIQCFVSLTDNPLPNMGGFEAAKGFHYDFDDWRQHRPPTTIRRKQLDGTWHEQHIPAPCRGAYTHMRPTEDVVVMQRIQHIPVHAGSVVFWDQRIPHANAYRHDGDEPRIVVYCSFLPDVEINRHYAKNQLQAWLAGRLPTDQWIDSSSHHDKSDCENDEVIQSKKANVSKEMNCLSSLGRRLLGLDSW